MPSFVDSPFWGRGFRPFFLSAAAYGIFVVLAWAGFYAGWWLPPGGMDDPLLWHAHEMVYGFSLAVVAGFLLTAVANWTGGAPARQLHLMLLWALWLAGRVAMNMHGLPLWTLAVIDSLFIPVLAVSLALPLLKSRNIRNFVFLGLLTVLFLANVGFFLLQTKFPVYAGLMVILIMIALVGGRVIPAFAVAALRRRGQAVFQHDQRGLDAACLVAMAGSFAAAGYFGLQSLPAAGLFFIASMILALRARRYHVIKSLVDPMLWILHAGYLWVVAGFAMMGFAALDLLPVTAAVHALTVGGIGSMCLGMMSRVTLGHTGREIFASRLTTASFFLMQVAAVVRVAGPVLWPDYYTVWLGVSGMLWSLCYALYLYVYAPMLVTTRPDGLEA